MLLYLKRSYRKEDLAILKRMIRKKYGRIEKIKKIMQVKKCSFPEIGEAYLFYLGIEDGMVEEEVFIEDKKVLNALTAKRFEIIEFLNKIPPLSIKDLANRLGRDYKNVYDDVSALSKFFVLNSLKTGKEIVPLGVVEHFEIRL